MGYHDFQRRPRGVIVIVVLVCLVVATAMSAIAISQIVAEREAVRLNHRRLQALWLAEAGVERAAAQVVADLNYAGETWTIPAAALAADDRAVVRINVAKISGQPQRRSIHVEADYSDASDRRCRQIKQIVVDRGAILSRQPTKAPH